MKEQIDVEIALEQLKGINPASGERLSYQKLMNKIGKIRREKAPRVMVLAAMLGIAALLSLNILVIENKTKPKENNLVNELGLMNNTSIYSGI